LYTWLSAQANSVIFLFLFDPRPQNAP
jgi:hypothetical protein